MTEITKSITYLNEYKSLKKAVDEGKTPVLTVGLSAIHKANLAAALGADTARPVLVLTDDDNAANRFAADLRGFSEREVVVLPPRELVMADVAGVSRGYEQARLAALDTLSGACFAVASVQAAAQRTMPPRFFSASSIVTLKEGERGAARQAGAQLSQTRATSAAHRSRAWVSFLCAAAFWIFFRRRPSIRTAWSSGTMRSTRSPHSTSAASAVWSSVTLRCLPCMEALPSLAKGGAAGLAKAVAALASSRRKKQHADLQKNLERDAERLRENGTLPAADKYLPLIYPQMATAFDYLPENTLILIEDTPRLRAAARDFHARIADDVTALMERGEMPGGMDGYALDFAGICSIKRQIVRMDSFLNSIPELAPQHLENFVANQMNAYGGNLDMASADIRSCTEQGRAVTMSAAALRTVKKYISTR